MQRGADINCEASLYPSFIRLSHHAILLFFVFAKYCKRACNYEDMSSCIGSKEELVAKQLVSGAMVTMNRGTTVCMKKKKKYNFEFGMMQVSLCSPLFVPENLCFRLNRVIILQSLHNLLMN